MITRRRLKVLIRNVDDIPSVSYGDGAQKRVVFGQKQGAPTFAMRIFDVPPGGGSSDHSHDFEHQMLILEGEGTLRNEQGDAPLKAGSALFVPANERHQLRNTGKENLRFVCVVPLRGEDSCSPL
ncbi:MAG: cupin domain-containing protein [Dehalococcoidia bacterium]|nr:MAG: cupin domain-containing protein [Dehalococcoidia bacterium]